MEIKTDKFNIEFLEEKNIGIYYLCKIKVACIKQSEFIPVNVFCNVGLNITDQGNDLNGNIFIQAKKMSDNESIEGYLCYMKYSTISTNKIKFSFNDGGAIYDNT